MSVPENVAVDEFGLPLVQPEDNPLLNWEAFEGEQQEQEEEIVEEPQAGEPSEPVQEPVSVESESVESSEQGAQEEAPVLLAGKYKEVTELEKGYKEAIAMHNRTAERANAANMRVQELEYRAQQLERALQQVLPVLEQRVAAPAPAPQPTPDQQWLGEQPQPQQQQQQIDPDALTAYMNTLVEQRVAEATAQARLEFETRAELEAERENIISFFQDKGIELNSPEDNRMHDTVLSLNRAWQGRGVENPFVNLADPDALNLAYEASQDDNLRRVLELHPEYFDSDEGAQMARIQAAMLAGQTITPQSAQVPASQVGRTVGQRKPVVESASQSASPRTRPNDEVAQAIAEYRKHNRDASEDLPFGV